MSNIDKTADAVKGAVDKARDTANEAGHRMNAELEKQKREHDDSMSVTDKISSVAKEAKERTQAEIDAAKRDAHK